MKTQNYPVTPITICVIWAFTMCSMLLWANPISTAFTYQGRLLDNNVAADGLYDIQFKLYDDSNVATGVQIGSAIVADDVDVQDGYFIAELNFGSAAFSGQARWLDIAIRPGASTNPADYISLQPRQEITVTPYALYALSSGVTRYGSGSVQVNLASRASAVVASIQFNYAFTAPPAVTITGKDNTGLTAGLIPGVANVTALGFDLVAANMSTVQVGDTYNFNWVAVGNGNLMNIFYKDSDADGYSDGTTSSQSPAPAGYYLPGQLTALAGDCDDTNAAVHPGAAEIWYDGIDENCDGLNDFDKDHDSYVDISYPGQAGGSAPHTGDCDDDNPAVHPGATEWCDGLDNDCDSVTDESCLPPTSCSPQQVQAFETCVFACLSGGQGPQVCLEQCLEGIASPCRESLLDLIYCGIPYGCIPADENSYPQYQRCLLDNCPTEYYEVYGPSIDADSDGYYNFEDCDDTNNLVHPGAVEVVDGIDNNCDGIVDDNPLAHDNDSDGWCEGWDHDNNPATPNICIDTASPGDCDDASPAVNPGAAEICDSRDNDCDGLTDPEGTLGCDLFYYEADGDGWYQTGAASKCLCDATPPYTALWEGDCDDTNPDVFPGRQEMCDGLDNDCDTVIDEDLTPQWCDWKEGVCQGVFEICIDGEWITCGPQLFELTIPDYEEVEVTCDGLDNDCDGTIDEIEGDLCPLQEGVCAGSTFICVDGEMVCQYPWWQYQPEETICDGLDNDCDGLVDEGCQ